MGRRIIERLIASQAVCHGAKRGHWFSLDEMEQIPVIPVSPGFGPGFGDDLFSLPPPDLVCYAYAMDNRQDAPYSPGSPELGRRSVPAEIISDGTKLAIERIYPKTTTHGINCSFQLYSINQNRTHNIGFDLHLTRSEPWAALFA